MSQVTNEGFQHGYCVVPSANRLVLLYLFLKRNLTKKVIVVFSSCNSVKFYSELLQHMQIDSVEILEKQNEQEVFSDFSKEDKGIILCSDVAARGLEIPSVDWIVQYDPPYEPKEYIHRIEGAKAKTLLFLIPQEMQFLDYLKAAKVSIKEYEFDDKKMELVKSRLEKLVENNYYLNKSAVDAYRSYLLAYKSHPMKEIFNVDKLDLQGVAASFCVPHPPKVDHTRENTASMFRTKRRRVDIRKHRFNWSNF